MRIYIKDIKLQDQLTRDRYQMAIKAALSKPA